MTADEKIVEMFFARSEHAIQELAKKYGKLCYHVSYNILNDRQDAEECVNEAYFGVWNSIPPIVPNSLQAYVSKIVRNISLNVYHAKKAAKRNSIYTIALEEIGVFVADPRTVETEMEVKELTHIIEEFLDTLTVENRVIFVRRYWFFESCKEIGKAVGLTEKNISVRLTRIRQNMKEYLREREVFV